jgi:Glycosyl transferase family group 2
MSPMLLCLLLLPVAMVVLDSVAGFRARRHTRRVDLGPQPVCHDFTVLVPIYGNIRYLENVAYLAPYRARVLLCTTSGETAEFSQALDEVALRHGFHVFRAPWTQRQDTTRRATSGTIRDRLIRDALPYVSTSYVIALDADSASVRSLSVLAGAMEQSGADVASVRLVPRNTERLLGKLQALEYRLAMGLRQVVPWLVSGACHIARTTALRDIMAHHSLFFQGNDVEVGLIAKRRGYKVAHIPFEVYTTVPDTLRAWFRQRLAWSGGEFRLFAVNARLGWRHPFLWGYGGLVTIAAFPARWWALGNPGWGLAGIAVLYVAVAMFLHRGSRWALLMPLYMAFSSLVMTPLGVVQYVRMAARDRNLGIIRPGSGRRRLGDHRVGRWNRA